MTVRGALQIGRGLVMGLAIVAIAGAFHAAAGGPVHLSSPLVLLMVVLSFAIAVLLSAREWTLPRLIVVLGIAQVLIHLGLQFAPEHSVAPDAASSVDMAGMDMAGMATSPSTPPDGSWTDGLGMLLAHALAVLVTALVLRRGETWLLGLVAALTRTLHGPRPWMLRPIPAAPVVATVASAPSAERSLLFTTCLARRGPPWAWDPTAGSVA